jgi:hypothetical protein
MSFGTDRPLRLFSALLLFAAATATTRAADGEIKVEAQLVWGTNLKESSNKDHKLIDGATAADLKKVFKWENYFVIKTETVTLKQAKLETLKMSEKCVLKIKSLDDDRVEVHVYGMGELICKGKQKLPPEEKWFLMGLAEDESSWLVILKRKKE